MTNARRLAACAGVVILFSSGAFGQGGGGLGAAVGYGGPAVPGVPYSAQQITEHRQTLADGTHIEDKPRTTLLFRDSQGRTRTENTIPTGLNGDVSGPTFISIQDPVAGVLYTLDTRNHIAHRVTIPPRISGAAPGAAQARISVIPPPPPPPPPPSGTSANRIQRSSESLGTQVMEGVTVEGRRITTTIPVGMQGNDRPLVSTEETWQSPDLKLMFLYKRSDPRNGETITRLTNITFGDPDPALFQVPADYTIVDDSNGARRP